MTTLRSYQTKRNFENTPEPEGVRGKSPKEKRRFVVQKHAASHLHYDFRLELNGVLKSWAVPKGPSLNPADKRLAIMVEDHPMDYRLFEGIIAKGNYGAGTVMVWDEGTYSGLPSDSSKQLEAGLHNGKIEFELHGSKLKGRFALVRMKQDEKSWLLIKKKDEFATEDAHLSEKSILTQRTMEQIGKKEVTFGEKTAIPHDIKPMLCRSIEEPFDDPEWLFEIKWDGYRAIAEVNQTKVELYSRNLKSFNTLFPTIVKSLKELKISAVFDGEVVLLDDQGRAQFQLLQGFQKSLEGTPVYYIFDLLFYQGKDLRHVPLEERKKLLRDVIKDAGISNLQYGNHIVEEGKKFFQAAAKKHLEGIIAKNRHGLYESSRSDQWLKIKVGKRQEVVICGFTEPRNSRQHFGALVLGVYKGKKLLFAGHVGTGFTESTLQNIYELMLPLITDKCPLSNEPKGLSKVTWVKPKLVCEVAFTEWTQDGSMRHPSFKGLRIDKPAKQVVRET